jgi:cytochrome P450/NADPH-cytochrome P450 reductase
MSQLQPGDALQVAVWPSHASFHPPARDDVPIVMVAVGTGIAPFRGFLQERRQALASNRKLAPAILYFGCRHPDKDLLYGDELRQDSEDGVADVRLVFSQASSEDGGCGRASGRRRRGRVNDALKEDFEALRRLWKEEGAVLYVCGSKRVADSVESSVLDGFRRNAREKGKDDGVERARTWLEGIRGKRYMVDAFG